MVPAHRKIVVAGLVVLVAVVVPVGCARNDARVRHVELIASDVGHPGVVRPAGTNPSTTEPRRETIGIARVSASRFTSPDPDTDRETTDREAEVAGVANGTGRLADETFRSLVAAAVRSGDLCGVWRTLELVPLDDRAPRSLARQMRLVAGVMDWAEEIVPATLVDDWRHVADGFVDIADLLEDGDTAAAARAYDDPTFAGSQYEVADWFEERCA